jgi:hypothetical protein
MSKVLYTCFFQHVSEFCKIREEIEELRTKCKKEFAASEEQRRISNDSTRFRLQTSNNFTSNAIKVWANELFLVLSRTENKIMDRLKQQRRTCIAIMVWLFVVSSNPIQARSTRYNIR